MKFLNLVFALTLSLAPLTGCAQDVMHPAVQPETSTEPVTVCKHKYSNELNISFYESKKTETHPAFFPTLTVYVIEDLNGVTWEVNEYDMVNYTCVTNKG